MIEYGKNAFDLIHRKIPRREALGTTALYSGVTLEFAALALDIVKKAILYTPSRTAIAKPAGLEIYPGWIGGSEQVFLNAGSGPADFMRKAIFSSAPLQEITSQVLTDIANADGRYNPANPDAYKLGLDQLYSQGLAHARSVFADINPNRISNQVDRELETMTAATTAIGFAVSGWATAEDQRKLGLGRRLIRLGKDPQTSFWKGPDSVAGRSLKDIFPGVVGPDEEPSAGAYRHFAVVTAVYHLTKLSMDQETNLMESSPFALRILTRFLAHKEGAHSNARVAGIFAETAAAGYEVKSTFDPDNLPWPGRRMLQGIFDDQDVQKDLTINAKAVLFGRLLEECIRRKNIIPGAEAQLIRELGEPNLNGDQLGNVRPIYARQSRQLFPAA